MCIYAGEMMGWNLNNMAISAGFFSYNLGGIFINLVSIKFNFFRFYLWLGFIPVLLSLLAIVYFVESPYYYKQKNQRWNLYNCLMKISSINNDLDRQKTIKNTISKKIFSKKLELNCDETKNNKTIMMAVKKESNVEKSKDMKNENTLENDQSKLPKIMQVFKKKCTRSNVSIFVNYLILLTNIDVIFGLSIIVNKYLGIENIHLSGCFIHIIQAVGYLCCIFFCSNFTRKKTNFATNFCIFIFGLALIILNLFTNFFLGHLKKPLFIEYTESGKNDQSWDSASFSARRSSTVLFTTTGMSCLSRAWGTFC